jgi:hypothetical protein
MRMLALVRIANAPITLWLLSAVGIGIFTTAYGARNQCISDAKEIMADYPNVVLEWSARLQPLSPMLDIQSIGDEATLIEKIQKFSALNAFKGFTMYELLSKLRKDRDEIDFSALKQAPSEELKMPDVIKDLALGQEASQFLATAIKYDSRLSPDLSEGMVAAMYYISFPDTTLPDLRTAVMNAIVLSVNENFRLAGMRLAPNCSYYRVFSRMLSGEAAPLVFATPRVAAVSTPTPKTQIN